MKFQILVCQEKSPNTIHPIGKELRTKVLVHPPTVLMEKNEGLMFGIRTKWGVSLHSLISVQNPSSGFYNKIEEFSKKNWLKVENETIFLVGEGWLMADYISAELFEVD